MSENGHRRNTPATERYKVYGLDCGEEVEVLKREVGSRDGVRELEFDVLRGRMRVMYDPDVIESDGIIAAVADAGMKAVLWEERNEEGPSGFWEKHGHLTMAIASGVFLIAGFVSHWIIHGRPLHGALLGAEEMAQGYPLTSLILFLGAAITGGWHVAPKAVAAVRRLRPDMHLLMMVAVLGAMIIGEWFEAGTVAFLFSVALLLEQWSVGRARRAIEALLDLSPNTARYICPHHGDVEEKPVEEVPVGATVIVRPGEKVPLDGVVTRGSTSINQAPITGESMPVSKDAGDEVFAGTINGEGSIEVEVECRAEDTTLARIIHMVEEAESRRAPAEQWVDKFARYYTPAMMLLAAFVAVVPPLIGGAGWTQWLYRGLVVLVIACPCALVISTPVSIVAGLTTAARHGVLIKGGVYLEAASRIRALALDKTGTLTRGEPEVQRIIPLNDHTPEQVLATAAALELHSEHPLARAIRRRAAEEGIDASPAVDFRAIKGKGAEARVGDRWFWIGSHRLMEEKGEETPEIHRRVKELEDAGHSVVALGNEDHVCGLITVADALRETAAETVRALEDAGLPHVIMLTGDNETTARAVAAAAGVENYRAELMPEDKVKAVEALVEEYHHVAMVGDGINDAPAMARADFGVAMGAMGTDAAIETADVALMSDDISRLPWLIGHSRRTLRVIKQNIAFALGVKGLFIILALLGVATLWMAIAADMGASLLVIFNGLRLLGSGETETG